MVASLKFQFFGLSSMPTGRQYAQESSMPKGQFHALGGGQQHALVSRILRGTQHAQGEQHARESSMHRGTLHIQGEQHAQVETACPGKQHSQGEIACPGETACPVKQHAQGEQHKRAIHSLFTISCKGVELFCCSPGMQSCPLGVLSPGYAAPFWACCCPQTLLLPKWKVFNKANLQRSRLLLIVILINLQAIFLFNSE
jgi:hypothetical protein